MANESILRSYLVSLGYALDEEGYRKFKANLQDTSKKMAEVGAVAVAAATELTASVLKIASNMDKLFFASQRTGASAKNIQALEYGAQQIGISAEEARGAVENLAAAMRLSPGLAGLLKSFNINPNEDRVQLLIDLVDRLRHLPFYQAAKYASLFGIDPKTLFQMEKNFDQLKAAMEESRRINPIDDDKVKKFHEFMVKVEQLTGRFKILINLIASRFLPIFDAVLPYLTAFLDKLIALDEATGGWSSVLLGVVAALVSVYGAVKALRTLGGFLGLGEAAEGAGILATVRGIAVWLTTIGGAAIVSGITALWLTTRRWRQELAGVKDIWDNLGSYVRHPLSTIYKMFSEEEYDPELRKKGITQHDSPEQKAIRHLVHTLFSGIPEDLPTVKPKPTPFVRGGDAGVPLHNPGNLRRWMNTPLINRGGTLGTFANFRTDEEGLSAMAGELLLYSKRNLDTVAKIVSTWAPASENDTRAYIADVSKKMGVGEGAHLDLSNPAVLQELMKDMIHHEQGRDPYNAKLIADAVNYRLSDIKGGGGAKVTINQDTRIDVHGSGDAKATAGHVLQGQDHVNADVVRNVGGVIR